MTGSGVEYRANPRFVPDNVSIKFGTAGDSRLYYDGSDLVISPADVGTGDLRVSGASLLLDSGEKIDFGAGDVMLTHASNLLTLGGGDFHVGDGNGVVIGHPAQITVALQVDEFQVLGNGFPDSRATIAMFKDAVNGPVLSLVKSRSDTVGAATMVQDNDQLGLIRFVGADGNSDFASFAVELRGEVDGTPGANDLPGRFIIATTADGAASPTDRVLIDSAGGVFIGDTANANMSVGLTINQGANDDQIIALKSSDVAHGFTTMLETDTFGVLRKSTASQGGLLIRGWHEGGSSALFLEANVAGAPEVTSTSSTNPIAVIRSYKKSGTAQATPTGEDAIWGVAAGGTLRLLLQAEGELHVTNTTLVALDDYPDALMGRAMRAELAPAGSFLSDQFRGIVAGARDFIRETGIMTPDPAGEPPMLAIQKATMFAWDMSFQNAGWIRDLMNVLTSEQRAKLPAQTREMLALMPAGS